MQRIQVSYTQKLDTQKLAILMTLISGGQRAHNIYSIRDSYRKVLNDVVIPIVQNWLNKLSQQNTWHLRVVRHITKSQVFVVCNLNEYLKGTKSYRDAEKLLLTCIKPYRAARQNTASSWCKSIIIESGISIHNYNFHSSRVQLHPMQIPWSIVINNHSEFRLKRTFAEFYKKQLIYK